MVGAAVTGSRGLGVALAVGSGSRGGAALALLNWTAGHQGHQFPLVCLNWMANQGQRRPLVCLMANQTLPLVCLMANQTLPLVCPLVCPRELRVLGQLAVRLAAELR